LVVALLTLELYVRGSTTLKDKRRALQGLLDKTKARFNVAVAIVAHQDDHQRATVAVACVGSDLGVVRGTLDNVTRLFDSHGEAEVAARNVEFL
jgi:uncharacterized protein YlxP (DUF503 family)